MENNLLATLLLFFGLIAVVAAIPQLLTLLKLKKSEEFSLSTWIIWLCYQSISVLYSIQINAYAYVAINSLWTLFYLCMVFLIIKYRR